jgi:hypothetical protein
MHAEQQLGGAGGGLLVRDGDGCGRSVQSPPTVATVRIVFGANKRPGGHETGFGI